MFTTNILFDIISIIVIIIIVVILFINSIYTNKNHIEKYSNFEENNDNQEILENNSEKKRIMMKVMYLQIKIY